MNLGKHILAPGRATVCSAPTGVDALTISEAVDQAEGPILFLVHDDSHAERMRNLIGFMKPSLKVLSLPAWDCLPYDRVSPNAETVAQRLKILCQLAEGRDIPDILIVTVSAALQRLPAKASLEKAHLAASVGGQLDEDQLYGYLLQNGYHRAGTVREAGEYAVRGGIIDIFPAGRAEPVRIDLFGDEVESIRSFDPVSQRTTGKVKSLSLIPVSEVTLDEKSQALFRQQYREHFGATTEDDPLYEAVREGRRHPGMEHWLPLFHEKMETVFDYLPGAPVFLNSQAGEATETRHEAILDYFQARQTIYEQAQSQKKTATDSATIYKPIPPQALFVLTDEFNRILSNRPVIEFSSFQQPEGVGQQEVIDAGGKGVLDFTEARKKPDSNIFEQLIERLNSHKGSKTVIAVSSNGALDRLSNLLSEHGKSDLVSVQNWSELSKLSSNQTAIAVMDLEKGFRTDDITIYSEQDILGERLARPVKRRRRGEEFISEISALELGDLVVHVEHGIGRYDGLETLTVDKAPHDCLRILYADDDKLYVPAENIEMLSRFGSEDSTAQLDKLGGVAWQARKAKIKERVKDIADKLLKIAAERALRKGEAVTPPSGLYDEFCARFRYSETDDQFRAIGDVIGDLGSGRPMDRLVCGDVGFGKTEVAMRAAFVAAMSGMQVAVVVPTTLLARQHYKNFKERFEGLPVNVVQMSRLVTGKDLNNAKQGIRDGSVDIVVGTHALLGKGVEFQNLGLLVVDEEQHFGVTQKERLKQLRANVHVLTLTATPIPRTLQMALTGVRELSIIATPPVDRLAVRTFVLPHDPVVLREAIMREHHRGGQVYYVCPRVADLDRMHQKLKELVPEIKIAVAHGQLTATSLEEVMNDFVDGKYDLLLSTNIVESGLDIPTANTMIIHRSDMFGLAQLYQLRGRIGRSKIRAYCYLTLPPGRILSDSAKKRLEVMQTLDSLGAGFSLASHDLDIRGAGNLLGDEQSGHIKEVGVELYQRMLEEAVAAAKDNLVEEVQETWSPTINLGSAVMIPEQYVADLSVRLSLYRRLSDLKDKSEIDSFAVELADRFGPLPQEVSNLLKVVEIKQFCKRASIEKVDAGPKGAVVTFRNNSFPNPVGLVGFLQQQLGSLKLRPDQKLVIMRPWETSQQRLNGVTKFMAKLAQIAEKGS
ncbi:transcription-repair coupling factor [Aestuariispira insulae]|uniref:Transcription-repair-coupling factor n=1 Tax=Aestuariispira insulae TaxID=1461337 RepID=A0A3D9HNL6_9PROT|nr:transcription-repair coupling factor [Aestuariispira insulae]RED51072.1 transcription-repair coupling factor [Aestuariispira insulae]